MSLYVDRCELREFSMDNFYFLGEVRCYLLKSELDKSLS